MSAVVKISDRMRQQAFDFYAHHENVPLNAIATFLGVSRHRFWRLRRHWGWPARSEATASAGAIESCCEVRPIAEAVLPTRTGLREAAASLAHVTHIRLDALIRDQAGSADIDHDRTARTLAAYAKTLTIAQSLLEQEGTALHEPEADELQPRSLHDLRDELASHLERIVAEEEARGSDGLLV